jgi:hypothetical protein
MGGQGDPFVNFNGNQIVNLLEFMGAPLAVIGRRSGTKDMNQWGNSISSQINIVPPINLSFTKSYNNSTRELTVNAAVTALRNIDTATRISLTLTENNLIYSQASHPNCPPGGLNYVHKHVARSMVNGALGEELSTGTWLQGTVRTKSWTTFLDNGWNAANCEIGVFVYFYLPNTTLSYQCYVLQTSKNAVITGISNAGEIAGEFHLRQNYPNPFNPSTNIKFSVPETGPVSLRIFDIAGNEVSVLWDNVLKAGSYNAQFEGTSLSSGVYFCRLNAGGFSETRKMILLK